MTDKLAALQIGFEVREPLMYKTLLKEVAQSSKKPESVGSGSTAIQPESSLEANVPTDIVKGDETRSGLDVSSAEFRQSWNSTFTECLTQSHAQVPIISKYNEARSNLRELKDTLSSSFIEEGPMIPVTQQRGSSLASPIASAGERSCKSLQLMHLRGVLNEVESIVSAGQKGYSVSLRSYSRATMFRNGFKCSHQECPTGPLTQDVGRHDTRMY